MRMLRNALLAIALAAFLFTTSCSKPLLDEKSIQYIENYSLEILTAVDGALLDLYRWLEDPGVAKILDDLEGHAETISEINLRYWTEEFPNDKEIEKCIINRKLNGKAWRIDGNELADALWFTGANSDALCGALRMIVDFKGALDEQEYDWLSDVVLGAEQAIRWLDKLMFQNS